MATTRAISQWPLDVSLGDTPVGPQILTERVGQSFHAPCYLHLGLQRRPPWSSNGLVVDVERLGVSRGLAWPSDMLSFIDNSVTLLPPLKECLARADERLPGGSAVPVEDVRLQAPIPRPRKNIFGIGLNYRAHMQSPPRALMWTRICQSSRSSSPSRRPR
jgi:hypothetical protein